MSSAATDLCVFHHWVWEMTKPRDKLAELIRFLFVSSVARPGSALQNIFVISGGRFRSRKCRLQIAWNQADAFVRTDSKSKWGQGD